MNTPLIPMGMLLCCLIGASAASAQPAPVEMKGVRLGASMEDLKKAPMEFSCSDSGECHASLELSYMRCLSVESCKMGAREDFQFGGAEADLYLARVRDDRVTSMTVRFQAKSFDTVIAALTVKYGKPAKVAAEAMTNAMGAKFANRMITWIWPKTDAAITAYERPQKLNESFVVMATMGELASAGSALANKAKANAKGL